MAPPAPGRSGPGSLLGRIPACRTLTSVLLRAVEAAGLLAVRDAGGVERTSDDLVTHTRKVADAPAADQHDRVLLEVVADARDVRRDLDAGREPHARDLAQRRVRLLRRVGEDARANATALRRALECRRLRLLGLRLPPLADELGDCGHAENPSDCAVSTGSASARTRQSQRNRVANQPGRRRREDLGPRR